MIEMLAAVVMVVVVGAVIMMLILLTVHINKCDRLPNVLVMM